MHKQLQQASAFLDNFERSFESFLSHQDNDDSRKTDNVQRGRGNQSFAKRTAISSASDLNSPSSISNILSENIPRQSLNPLQRQSGVTGTASIKQSQSRNVSSVEADYVPQLVESKPSISLSRDREVNNRSRSELPLLEEKHKIDKIEKEPRRFQCNVCPKSFKQSGHLKEHQMTHSGNFPFNCVECKRGFRRETSLISHRCTPNSQHVSVENKSSKGFSCEHCGRTYASKQYFSMHKCIEEENRKEFDHDKKSSIITSKEKLFESVAIEVPVEVVRSEVIFDKKDGTAIITGCIIELETDSVQLEEADAEGYEVEVVNTDGAQDVIKTGTPELLTKGSKIPCAFEAMSKDTGLSMKEITDLFSDIPDQVLAEQIVQFPWQVSSNEKQDDSSKFNSLHELPNVFPVSAGPTPVPKKRISMNNFTYFNDKSAVYVDRSGDDTDDEDWSESSKFKCNPCKKDFSTNGQLKKHNKQHFGLNNSISNGVSTKKASQNMKLKCSQCKTCFRNESERNVHKCNKPTLDNSLLLQEDDDAENITKMPSKSESNLILFSTLA